MKKDFLSKSFTSLRTVAAICCIVVVISGTEEADANYFQGQYQQVYRERQQQRRPQGGRFQASVRGEGSSVNYQRCNSGSRNCVNYNLQGEDGAELELSEVATSTTRPAIENRGNGYLPQGSQGRGDRNNNGGNFHSSFNGREEARNSNGNSQNHYENEQMHQGQPQSRQARPAQPERRHEKIIRNESGWGNVILLSEQEFNRERRNPSNFQGGNQHCFRICDLTDGNWLCGSCVNNAH